MGTVLLHANLRYANGTSAESERKQRVPRKKVFILLLFPFPSWLDNVLLSRWHRKLESQEGWRDNIHCLKALVHRRCTDVGAGQNAIKEKSREWGKRNLREKKKGRGRKEEKGSRGLEERGGWWWLVDLLIYGERQRQRRGGEGVAYLFFWL